MMKYKHKLLRIERINNNELIIAILLKILLNLLIVNNDGLEHYFEKSPFMVKFLISDIIIYSVLSISSVQ